MVTFGRCRGCGAEVRVEFSVCPFCDTPLNTALGPGSIIDDRYVLETRIGAGGMGEVWRARHLHLDVARVVKLIRHDLTSDLDAQERFVREARLATRISHPNVSVLHDFATLDDGRWYMAWELIEGRTIAAFIRERGVVPPAQAVRLAAQALDGLEAIHAAGIVHRDVSPDNIMIMDASGGQRIRIIDLGVARDALLDGPARTQAGMFLGKLKYASPEQLGTLHEGEPLDGRADVYSMAIVLYEMLTGSPPFAETTPHGLVLSHTTRPPRSLAEIAPNFTWSSELQSVLLHALEKDRDKRFATAGEFAAALRAIEPSLQWSEPEQTMRVVPPPAAVIPTNSAPVDDPQERIATTPSNVPVPPRSTRARLPLVPLLAAAVAICSGVGIAAFVVFHDRGGAREQQPIAAASVTPAPEPTQISVQVPAPTETAPAPGTAGVNVDVAGDRPEPSVVRPPSKARPERRVEPSVPVPPAATETVAEADPRSEPAPPPPQIFTARAGGRRFLDDRAVRRGWQRGFLPDYSALTRHESVEWAWIAPEVTLSEYRISVGRFRNSTSVDDAEVRRYLDVNMQQLINGVTTNEAGALSAEGLIWWAAEAPARPRGIAIEMIFRNDEGRIVAMLRHLIRENTPADAAQEMADAVQEFIEENG